MFLQYFDTVGWVFWPVKTVSHITYTVLAGRKSLLLKLINKVGQVFGCLLLTQKFYQLTEEFYS